MSPFNWRASVKRFDPRYRSIEQKILANPYYRLQSSLEIEIAVSLGVKIDVNRSTIDDWLRLPIISIHQARSIAQLIGTGVRLLCLEDVAAALGLAPERLDPYAPIFQFEYYDSDSLLAPQKININTASWEQLEQIPILELETIAAIYQNRQEFGNYRNLADLQSRLNLNIQSLSQLMYYLIF
jgi:DNA uptake protein ComE-like DNA-binding protein